MPGALIRDIVIVGGGTADLRPLEEVRAFLADTQRVISACVEAMPTHAEFIAQHFASM